jgi:hypothetical protein
VRNSIASHTVAVHCSIVWTIDPMSDTQLAALDSGLLLIGFMVSTDVPQSNAAKKQRSTVASKLL